MPAFVNASALAAAQSAAVAGAVAPVAPVAAVPPPVAPTEGLSSAHAANTIAETARTANSFRIVGTPWTARWSAEPSTGLFPSLRDRARSGFARSCRQRRGSQEKNLIARISPARPHAATTRTSDHSNGNGGP